MASVGVAYHVSTCITCAIRSCLCFLLLNVQRADFHLISVRIISIHDDDTWFNGTNAFLY